MVKIELTDHCETKTYNSFLNDEMIITSISETKIPSLHFQGVGGEKGSKGEIVSPDMSY